MPEPLRRLRGRAVKNAWAVTIAITDDGATCCGWQASGPVRRRISAEIRRGQRARQAALGRPRKQGYEDMSTRAARAFPQRPVLAGQCWRAGVPIMAAGQCVRRGRRGAA